MNIDKQVPRTQFSVFSDSPYRPSKCQGVTVQTFHLQDRTISQRRLRWVNDTWELFIAKKEHQAVVSTSRPSKAHMLMKYCILRVNKCPERNKWQQRSLAPEFVIMQTIHSGRGEKRSDEQRNQLTYWAHWSCIPVEFSSLPWSHIECSCLQADNRIWELLSEKCTMTRKQSCVWILVVLFPAFCIVGIIHWC
jgi:hypothetical protein